MANNRRRKKKIPVKKTMIVSAVVVILGLIFLIASGGIKFRHSASRDAEIAENARVLKEMEEKKPEKQISADTDDPKKEDPSDPEDTGTEPKEKPDVNLSEEEEKIMNMNLDDYNDALTRKWFENAVILGDSISLAAAEYGYLDFDKDLSVIGASLASSDEQFEMAIAQDPSVVFMVYGGNDISNYLGDPNLFIDQYKTALGKLKAALPNATFYLHAILPEQEGVGYEPGYEYREDYNKALEEYCETEDRTYYVSADFLLENDPGLYDADGIHPVGQFYPRWLTYLADISGLSSEDD